MSLSRKMRKIGDKWFEEALIEGKEFLIEERILLNLIEIDPTLKARYVRQAKTVRVTCPNCQTTNCTDVFFDNSTQRYCVFCGNCNSLIKEETRIEDL